MKIVLVVEKGKGRPAEEMTFEKPVVRFGRDAGQCEIAVDNRDYRMVSRVHAEARVHKGKWIVRDLGSSYGTFVSGQKLANPRELAVGNSIQLGPDGPKAHVIWMEADAGESAPPSEPISEQSDPAPTPSAPEPKRKPEPAAVPSPPPPQTPEAKEEKRSGARRDSGPEPPKSAAQPAEAVISFENDPGGSEVRVGQGEVWMGRDPKCEVVIEASAVMVSRRHAMIGRRNGSFLITDNDSFNGTLVNGSRISTPTPLGHGDKIQLGPGGPVLNFSSPGSRVPEVQKGSIPGARLPADVVDNGTMVVKMGDIAPSSSDVPAESQLLMQVSFDGRSSLTIGRSSTNEISLDGLQISNRHARLKLSDSGVTIEDLNSTNGVYVNGERETRRLLSPEDSVQVGAFIIRVDENNTIGVFDTRSKTRLDAVGLSKEVRNKAGKGKIRLLDDVSLSIGANEFIGVLGPSGCGKTTLINALNGTGPATEGSVYINDLDLYRYIDSLKSSIGSVPQDDIIHQELSVYDTLWYIAKLRLSRDVSRKEIDQIINEVLDVTDLTERSDVAVSSLSGGQRKRVSIAVELITKPSVIFLDEPTSGLDPSTEEKIMKLFRQIAESGRTIVLTTHAMENVRLFDKIVVLMRGRLVFYGKPQDALSYLGVSNFKQLYDKLEEPAEAKIASKGEWQRIEAYEEVADEWRAKFRNTPFYEEGVAKPLAEVRKGDTSKAKHSHRLGVFGTVRQFFTLSARYAKVLAKDKFTLAILALQAPVIAFLVFIVMGSQLPRDFAYFALSLCAIWFGTSVAAREIVRERKIYQRERMVNLGILPYVGSKLFVLGFIVAVQCFLLFIPLQFFNLTGLMPMPGVFLGIPQFVTMLITAAVGIAIGLFVSTIVKTSEMATSLVPLILIPQIVFSGLIGVPEGINKVVGLTMPAAWSFDTMKRFSTLDTLEPEGALLNGGTEGLGLYKHVEQENEKLVSEAKTNVREYEKEIESRVKDAEKRTEVGEEVKFEGLPDRPQVGEPETIPDDLSGYITFLHPWMHPVLNQLVLLFMFSLLFIWTLIILKIQDLV
ncbi:MAG: FHA domain-containing protein [Acidobacteria bacterium]|nr:MAG: FHA domain-containing protein [Acidobacteriota bacterium]REK02208.1 MAG: FHA domain-containing protein [Acidobacteriota bacterium]REK13989.1 MAG: FHA domain-containing protein [Acidobacteriota bacterium]REK41984.1 MAG: FHA domain-containing protein [Acidobacteriota bacterium]